MKLRIIFVVAAAVVDAARNNVRTLKKKKYDNYNHCKLDTDCDPDSNHPYCVDGFCEECKVKAHCDPDLYLCCGNVSHQCETKEKFCDEH